MTTKASRLVRWSPLLPLLVAAGGIAFLACSPEFKASCPEGTLQTAGGGDVKTACTPLDQLAGKGGTAGEGGGQGGEGGVIAGQGGGPAGVCTASQTRCQQDKQETCGEDGQWGTAKECDIKCDAEGSKCVVPVQIATTGAASYAILSDGTLRAWGRNAQGSLGLGVLDEQRKELKPVVVPGLGNLRKIAAGGNNACALTQEGAAYCWGANSEGQVSPNGEAIVTAPALLPERDIEDVSCGGLNSCIVRGGSVWCKGDNRVGQLGNGTMGASSNQFVAVQGIIGVPKQVGGNRALVDSGDVYCWGSGEQGSLGQGASSANSPVALKVKGNASDVSLLGGACVLRRDGAVVCWGSNYFGSLGRGTFGAPGGDSPFDGNADFVSNLSSVVQVSAGLHACAVKADNSLWCWGLASYGQLGNDCSSAPCRSEEGPFSPLPLEVLGFKAKAVVVGFFSTCAIDLNDSVYCWGLNDSGQFGNGEVSAGMNPTPTRVLWK